MTVATGEADDAVREQTLSHIDECDSCRAALASLVASQARSGSSASLRDSSRTVGRYELQELVGQGAMGVVYAAYDPPLDRRVAIKLLRPSSAMSKHAQDTLRQRLLREARALAKVAHPNVIAAFDVGEHDGEVFLAMELVEGETLTQWLAREPRTTTEIVAMFAQAGEGLAAAHDASVIHRDFKPDNVLVGRDGRARVTDFGLARGADKSVLTASYSGGPSLDVSLTSTGALAGTPLFMAAEQLDGRPASERTDQFSFAVALWTALFGARPFEGETVEALARNVRATNIAQPTASAREVSAGLRATIERALQSDPSARFESMRAMLRALAPYAGGAGRSRAPWVIAAASVTAAVVLVALSARPRADPCVTGAAQIASMFTEQRAGEMRRAFERASPRTGAFAFARVREAIERFSSRWATVSDGACRDSNRSAGAASAQCLDALRTQASAVVTAIAPSDEASLERAISAALTLPAPDVCARGAATASERFAPADPSVRAAARRIEAALAGFVARRTMGLPQPPLQQLIELEQEATARSLRVLSARARVERGWTHPETGEGAEDFRVALERSTAFDDPLTMVDASTGLIAASAHSSDIAAAELAAVIGAGALRRIGADPPREALRLAILCQARERQTRDFARAMEPCVQARRRFVEIAGGENLQSAFMDDQLGNIHLWQGHYDTSLAHYRSAEAVRRAHVGGGEGLDNTYGNIAEVLIRLRRYDEAEAILRDLIARRNLPHHWDGLAESLRRRGRFEPAMEAHRRALALCEATQRSGCVRYSLIGIAECELALGRAGDARGTLERATTIEGTPPAIDAVRLAFVRARIARALGQGGLAASAHREARSILDGVSPGIATSSEGPFGELRTELDAWEREGAPGR
ncbi:MAG: serine/threonine-protein kinase [Polyangiales bacterium]